MSDRGKCLSLEGASPGRGSSRLPSRTRDTTPIAITDTTAPFPITAAEIAKTEAKTGFTFPPRLEAHLSKSNGSEADEASDFRQLIPFLDVSDRRRLARTCDDTVRQMAMMGSNDPWQVTGA